jgi:hypothetical protein
MAPERCHLQWSYVILVPDQDIRAMLEKEECEFHMSPY